MLTLALLHLQILAAQAPPGTLVTSESVALGVLVAVVGVAVAYGLMRSQVSDLRDRIVKVETTYAPLTLGLARVEVRLDHLERGVASITAGVDGLRRELHASRASSRGDE
jgi:hypothetical protein